MRPQVALLLLLGSACCGSAQLIFNTTKSVEYTICNETVVIPCIVINGGAEDIAELYVKWKLKGQYILNFDGEKQKLYTHPEFPSARISQADLLKGIASLKMNRNETVVGNYTCEVTELTREGETIIELKYRVVSWFSPNENILVVIFPILAILLSWGQFGIMTLKYKSSNTKEKTILLFVAGLVLTAVVVVGAFLFASGEYSAKNASGLGLIVIPTAILILLQYCVFMIAIGMSSFTILYHILILQGLGYVLSLIGLSLCVSECTPVHGPLLISGLGIIALAELLGLVYMTFVASNQKTLQPPGSN
ncbi:leukocyte surface antigen CD47-like [Suncus etruscus]|uniref:leukocyte surface antigen CD47-like n=1 Tax=Suncus etruscus TaxID=109475 RepID=UPI00210F6EBA|nr:leukocyte surface antigen CD47-like [Suncus etruscus]